MIERGNPLFAVTKVTSATKKFRDKTLESEQIRTLLGPTKGADSRLHVKQRFENTNSRPITTEEVFKS